METRIGVLFLSDGVCRLSINRGIISSTIHREALKSGGYGGVVGLFAQGRGADPELVFGYEFKVLLLFIPGPPPSFRRLNHTEGNRKRASERHEPE